MKMRNAGIELFRILLMLGIVALHTLCYVGKGLSPMAHLCEACVVGFVFISGYYGVTFTFRKLASFYGIVLYCAGWNIFCRWFQDSEANNLWWHFCRYLRVWWFANAYVFLMLMSPLVNTALDSCRTTRELMFVSLPAVAIVFLWGFISSVPFLHDYIPVDKSIVTNSGLTLMAIYILARLFRILEVEKRFKPKVFAWVGCFCAAVCMLNLGKYNSIVSLILMASLFSLFKKVGELPLLSSGCLGHIIALCAPSMFSVYLIHVGGFVWLPFGCRGASTTHLAGNDPSVIRIIGVVVLVFCVSFSIDLIRRCFLGVIHRIATLLVMVKI